MNLTMVRLRKIMSIMSRTHQPRIVVVDDDPVNSRAIRICLESSVYIVSFFAAAEDFLHAFSSEVNISLIISDIHLAEMSGLELCRKVRSHDRNSGLSILLMTGIDEREARSAGLAAGADGVMMKPFSPKKLLERVAELIQKPRSNF
jgi:DNA-binding response OmpR family regulator